MNPINENTDPVEADASSIPVIVVMPGAGSVTDLNTLLEQCRERIARRSRDVAVGDGVVLDAGYYGDKRPLFEAAARVVQKWWRAWCNVGAFEKVVARFIRESGLFSSSEPVMSRDGLPFLASVEKATSTEGVRASHAFWARLFLLSHRLNPGERRGLPPVEVNVQHLTQLWFIAQNPTSVFYGFNDSERLLSQEASRLANKICLLVWATLNMATHLSGSAERRLPLSRRVRPIIAGLPYLVTCLYDGLNEWLLVNRNNFVNIGERTIRQCTLQGHFLEKVDSDVPVGQDYREHWLKIVDENYTRACGHMLLWAGPKALEDVLARRDGLLAKVQSGHELELRKFFPPEEFALIQERFFRVPGCSGPFFRIRRTPSSEELATLWLCMENGAARTASRAVMPMLSVGPSQWYYESREAYYRSLKVRIVNTNPPAVESALTDLCKTLNAMGAEDGPLASVFTDGISWEAISGLFRTKAEWIRLREMGTDRRRMELNLEAFFAFLRKVVAELVGHEEAEDRVRMAMADSGGPVEAPRAPTLINSWRVQYLEKIETSIGRMPESVARLVTAEDRQNWREEVANSLMNALFFVESYMCSLYLRRRHEQAVFAMPRSREEAIRIVRDAFAGAAWADNREDSALEARWLFGIGSAGPAVQGVLMRLGLDIVERADAVGPDCRPAVWRMSATAALRFVCDIHLPALLAAERVPASWHTALCPLMNLWATFLGQFLRMTVVHVLHAEIHSRNTRLTDESKRSVLVSLSRLPGLVAKDLFGIKASLSGEGTVFLQREGRLPCDWETPARKRSELLRRAEGVLVDLMTDRLSTDELEEGSPSQSAIVGNLVKEAISQEAISHGYVQANVLDMMRSAWYRIVFDDKAMAPVIMAVVADELRASARALRDLVDAIHSVFGDTVHTSVVVEHITGLGPEEAGRIASVGHVGREWELALLL